MGINSSVLAAAAQEPSLLFVCVLGVAVVFVGLVCIIGIVMLMNMICNGFTAKRDTDDTAPVAPAASVAPTAVAPTAPIENRQEIIAAVCAAIAEENGTDISAIRVISFKKL